MLPALPHRSQSFLRRTPAAGYTLRATLRLTRAVGGLRVQHLITAGVAAALIALAAFEGGFGPATFSAGALFVWSVVLVGLIAGFLPREEPPRAAIVAGGLFAALVGLKTLSAAWASDDGRVFEDVIRAVGYLGLFTLVVLSSRPGGAAGWLRAIAIGLVGVAAISLLARFDPSLALSFADTDAEIGRDLPTARGRLSHPIGYWNGIGAAMALCLVLLAWLAASAPSRVGRSVAVAAMPLPILALYMSASTGGVIAAVAGLAVLVIAATAARTRILAGLAIGGAAGGALILFASERTDFLDRPGSAAAATQGQEMFGLALIAIAVALAVRHELDPALGRLRIPPSLARAATTGAAVVVLAGAVAADLPAQYEEFKQAPTGEEGFGSSERDVLGGGGSNGRWQFWGAAVDAFETEPLRGIGAGGYEAWWTQNGSLAVDARNAHSLFFDVLSENGMLGVLAALGFFGVAIGVGISRLVGPIAGPGARPGTLQAEHGFPPPPVASTEAGAAAVALLAAGAISASADWTWDLPAVFAPAVVAAALLTGPASQVPLPGARPRDVLGAVRSRRRFAGGVAVLLTAWVAICASALLLLATNAISSSQDASARGDLAAAAESANDAIDLEPWAAEPRSQLALVLERARDIGPARREIVEAIERAPEDWRLWVIAIRLDLTAEDYESAADRLDRLRELNPNDPMITDAAEQYIEFLRENPDAS
jgi:O-antigen ligase